MSEEYSVERRKALIEQMRSQSPDDKKKKTLPPVSRGVYDSVQSSEEDEFPQITMWKVKFFLAIFLFIGFLVLDTTDYEAYNVSSDSIETMITDTIKTEKVSSFIQNQISEIF